MGRQYRRTRPVDHEHQRLLGWLDKHGGRAPLDTAKRNQQLTRGDLDLWQELHGGFRYDNVDGVTYLVREDAS